MENSSQPHPHPASLASQGYNHQLQPAMWNGNKVCTPNTNQNVNTDHYSQQMNHFYQAPYSTSNSNEMNRYLSPAPNKDPNSNSVAYPSQYPAAKQNNFSCANPSPNYPMNMKNNMYYTNVNVSKAYPLNNMVQAKKYTASNLGPLSNTMPQMPNYGDELYVNNANVQENLIRQASNLLSSHQEANQVSSIPTPPETSLPGDDTSAFVLPGSSVIPMPSNRNLQPPANLDEGSQASSASASSSLPDEQNSAKANSKPNFSYPPTPNTLSSPGAASMSSFHDDLECISSPGWPKTPASPVANSNYEFANIKRPENLLKLYTISDEPDRRYFLDKLIVFNEERGSPITQCPTISKQPLDVFKVYITVKERGGFLEVTNGKRWKDIAGAIGVGASSSAAYTLRKQYMKLLLPFECQFDRGGIDPQPIINMVEASSRKKAKNTTSAYGNSNPYNQNYSQVVDRYHSNYPSYQSSRYPCNSMEYQCSTNSMNYQQSTHPTAVTGSNQYNQYSQNSMSNYGYYQGNNSTVYNSNLQTNASNPTCRYGNTRNSSAVPHQQEQGYYAQQYSSQQETSYVSQENLIPPVSNDVASYSKGRKAASDPLLSRNASCGSLSSSNFDNKSYCNNYNASSGIINTTCTPSPDTSQTYQQSASEIMVSKIPDINYYSSSQVSHSTVNSYSNPNQSSYMNPNSYPNQKFRYQAKEQVQSSQFGQYLENQNESYQGSEGPPPVQVDPCLSSGDIPADNAKMYPCNTTTQKVAGYNYNVQHGDSKNVCTPSNSHFNSGPQRTWPADQNNCTYQPPVPNQRLSPKSQFNPPAVKQSSDSSLIRKPWVNSQESEPIPNKPQNLPSVPAKNPTLPAIKSQPPSIRVSQAFQSMLKKPLEFPSNSVESVKAVAVKRRRCPARRLGSIDPWRLMLGLKSGLLAECTWALDTLCILLADNNTVIYFALTHLPGLLNVLVDHYRCLLNKIFHLANDVEIETMKRDSDFSYLSLNEISDLENKLKLLDTPNYTYKTRCKKKVEIQYDEALFLIDPQRSWDKYEGFDVSLEQWQKGGGDITSHILTTFDNSSKKIKFCREEKTKPKLNRGKSIRPVLSKRSSLGEPVVVLQKFNFLVNKISASDGESDAEPSDNSLASIKTKLETIKKEEDSMDPFEVGKNIVKSVPDTNALDSSSDRECEKRKAEESNSDTEVSSRLRGSASSRKRFLCENLEDEAYCFDEPALCGMSDSQEMLSRRCVCVATILRNLSFVPGNELIMAQNSGVLLLLGRLLLLHHEHKPTKNAYHKYEKETESWNESCISLKEDPEWWWGTLSVLRDNTLVILSNLSGQLDLAPFPEEVSLPILDGLLHWIVCPSSYAQDPLPSPSVLSPQRLSLEALCKLSVLSSNVDLILATPPWSRIENLFAFLTKSLCHGQDQIVREFALILLSNISEADSVAARTIAEQSHSISYLIAFIEEAEANAFQIAISQGTKKLRDKPELMGTTPGMVKRAASTLKNLALVGENRSLFVRHQAKLLSLVMSQVMDEEVATVIADVLFYSSEDTFPIS